MASDVDTASVTAQTCSKEVYLKIGQNEILGKFYLLDLLILGSEWLLLIFFSFREYIEIKFRNNSEILWKILNNSFYFSNSVDRLFAWPSQAVLQQLCCQPIIILQQRIMHNPTMLATKPPLRSWNQAATSNQMVITNTNMRPEMAFPPKKADLPPIPFKDHTGIKWIWHPLWWR